jgi:hypothetical protein
MDDKQRAIIIRFASGEKQLRKEAINIYHSNLGKYNGIEMLFMSEIDSDCPDLVLRSKYREQLSTEKEFKKAFDKI